MQSQADHHGVETPGRKRHLLRVCPNEMQGTVSFDFACEQQVPMRQIDPDHRLRVGRERWEQNAWSARNIQRALDVWAKGFTNAGGDLGVTQCGRRAKGLGLPRELCLDCLVVAQDAAQRNGGSAAPNRAGRERWGTASAARTVPRIDWTELSGVSCDRWLGDGRLVTLTGTAGWYDC